MIQRSVLINDLEQAKQWRKKQNKRNSAILSAAYEQITSDIPVATAGLFAAALDEWQANVDYPKNATFVYDGAVYFTRQAVTSAAHQAPGSTGMEAIYGVRPIPDSDCVYPYMYNMAASVGMRVRENEDIYVCTRNIDPLLYPPSQVAAHFDKE